MSIHDDPYSWALVRIVNTLEVIRNDEELLSQMSQEEITTLDMLWTVVEKRDPKSLEGLIRGVVEFTEVVL